ncbi:DinB family protein [Mycobacterium sp.]|uniref:DinB family protein n=1 Tax=Mycobacterium sp. TaxID=1785 RepID=UPI003D0FEAB0
MSETQRTNRREQHVIGERASLEAFLDDYRDILVRKVSGLSDADARRNLVTSATTVGGLVKHLRWAEYGWFEQFLQGRRDDNRRTHAREWEFEIQADESLPALVAEYQAQCEQSRRVAAQFSLDHELRHRRLETTLSLRWIYLHMIQETARHTGQIDILREQLDGATGFE